MYYKHINASAWPSITIGAQQFFSPNSKVLQQIANNPDNQFWHNNYTEFACVIINLKNQHIRIVRDHIGLEPLFYTLHQDTFIFGSNLPDIIQSLGYTPKFNISQLKQMLLNKCTPSGIEYSDETNYMDIYRVEPGSILDITENKINKSLYWQLPTSPTLINYKDPYQYIEHFTELLNTAIKLQMEGHTRIAAEFSGGLDSATIISGFKQLNLEPHLFMHVAPRVSNIVDDSKYADELIRHYHLTNYSAINADSFDLLTVIEKCSKLFAGSPQYLFPVGANNIHQAVADAGYTVLFSGFGGDECVSSHAPLAICLREYLQNGNYRKAWQELNAYYSCNKIKKPSRLRLYLTLLKNIYRSRLASTTSSLREHEYNLLQGKYSHHLRLRVEESAIIAKTMGFSYKYPLLYPPLLEFCHRLPLDQKRQNGENRLLVRNYLAQYLPASVYQKHQKIGSIMPATIHKIQHEYASGQYQEIFNALPYADLAKLIRHKYPKNSRSQMLQEISLYGIKLTQAV